MSCTKSRWPGVEPSRRNVEFLECAETLIAPLIDELTFITYKRHWGYVFCFGLFEIPQTDFERIKDSMAGKRKAQHVIHRPDGFLSRAMRAV
jgi:hypothetical protein